MNKQKFKNITIYSLILGAILGIIGVIPYIYVLPFLIMSVISSVIVVIYMEQKQQIGELTIKGGAILGAYIGFISMLGFMLINLPINALISMIFKFFSPAMLIINMWWLVIIMGGMIVALFNSFSLIAYVYIRDTFSMIEGKKEIKGNFIQKDKNNGI